MSAASALGLTVDDAIVLHDSNRLAVRLLPCDVLARVAPAAHQAAQFEVELAQRLGETGSPVAALESRAGPRVCERDGFAVTLWTYYSPGTPQRSAQRSAVASARRRDAPNGWPVRIPMITSKDDHEMYLSTSRAPFPLAS
jgi:hypothetical protein